MGPGLHGLRVAVVGNEGATPMEASHRGCGPNMYIINNQYFLKPATHCNIAKLRLVKMALTSWFGMRRQK